MYPKKKSTKEDLFIDVDDLNENPRWLRETSNFNQKKSLFPNHEK